MRLVTMLMMATLMLSAGCSDATDGPADAGVDLRGSPPLCAPGAEGAQTLRCDYGGADTVCRSTLGYDCNCLCTGFWECDQVHVVCDPDLGTPHD